MGGHNACFHLDIRKIIFELSSGPRHICSSGDLSLFYRISIIYQSFVTTVPARPGNSRDIDFSIYKQDFQMV